MSYSICYLIDVNGTDFNYLMKQSHQVPRTEIEEFVKTRQENMWDGILLNSDIHFLVDLTGDWTLCTLPYAYSALLNKSTCGTIVDIVENWEWQLQQLLPTHDIYRIDDFLLDQWNSRYDYLLVRNTQAVLKFIEWLQTQDCRHWEKLQRKRTVNVSVR